MHTTAAMGRTVLTGALAVLMATGAMSGELFAQASVRFEGPMAVREGEPAVGVVRAAYAAALNEGDARRLSALYAPDAVVTFENGVTVRGAAEIEAYFARCFVASAERATVTLTLQELSARENVASETGTFAEARSGDGSVVATGVYVTIYAAGADGEWRIAMEVRTRGRDNPLVHW